MSKSKMPLMEYIVQRIAQEPFEYDSAAWTKVHLKSVAEHLGISVRTVKTLVWSEPIRHLVIEVDGQRCTLLRVGGEPTMAEHQRMLAALWKHEVRLFNGRIQKAFAAEATRLTLDLSKIEAKLADATLPKAVRKGLEDDMKRLKPRRDKFVMRAEKAGVDAGQSAAIQKKEFGCLRGLLEDWGPDEAPALLRFVVRHWVDFKVALTGHLVELEAHGAEVAYRFHDFPSLTIIRRFSAVVMEVHLTVQQMDGKVDITAANQMLKVIAALKDKNNATLSTAY